MDERMEGCWNGGCSTLAGHRTRSWNASNCPIKIARDSSTRLTRHYGLRFSRCRVQPRRFINAAAV